MNKERIEELLDKYNVDQAMGDPKQAIIDAINDTKKEFANQLNDLVSVGIEGNYWILSDSVERLRKSIIASKIKE